MLLFIHKTMMYILSENVYYKPLNRLSKMKILEYKSIINITKKKDNFKYIFKKILN